jgi:hypothetical protein
VYVHPTYAGIGPDGHQTVYPLAWLREQAAVDIAEPEEPILWNAQLADALPIVAYEEVG